MRQPIGTALRTWRGAALAVSLAAFAVSAAPPASAASPLPYLQWPMFGQNFGNTATGLTLSIGPSNVGALTPKWAFTTGGDVSARAAVVDGGVYFPDWGGNFYRLNARSGQAVWAKSIAASYFGGALGPKVVSRTSPAV